MVIKVIYMGKAKIICDDDHFTTSSVHLKWGENVPGVSIEIHPQMGRKNFAHFHLNDLHTLIAVLTQAETEEIKRIKGE